MPFSHRVFCRVLESPSLSEVLIWMRQQEQPARLGGGRAAGDLLSCYWDDATLERDDGAASLRLRCLRQDASGAGGLVEEVDDFVGDLSELPPSPERARVLEHLAATRALVIVEFPDDGASSQAEEMAASLCALFVERARGLTQRDGVGFLDEDEDVVLRLG